MCLLFTGLVAGDNIEPDKGTEKLLKKQKPSSWAAHIVQIVTMFGFTGSDSILMENHSIYYIKMARQQVVLNTPLILVSVDYITHIHWTHYYWCNSVRFSSLLLCSKVVAQWYKHITCRTKTWSSFHFEFILQNHNHNHNLSSLKLNKKRGNTCIKALPDFLS